MSATAGCVDSVVRGTIERRRDKGRAYAPAAVDQAVLIGLHAVLAEEVWMWPVIEFMRAHEAAQ